jgi:hypothetical protein
MVDKLEEVLYAYIKDEDTLKRIYGDDELKMLGNKGRYERTGRG